jgi:hypothetical protein
LTFRDRDGFFRFDFRCVTLGGKVLLLDDDLLIDPALITLARIKL